MSAKRKIFICNICNNETSQTISNYYKQKNKIGYNRCSKCAKIDNINKLSLLMTNKYKNVPKNTDVISINCCICNEPISVQARSLKRNKKIRCKSCVVKHNRILYKSSYSKASKEINKKHKQKIVTKLKETINTLEHKSKKSKISKSLWENNKYKSKSLKTRQSQEYQSNMKAAWTDEKKTEQSKRMSAILKAKWQDSEYRAKLLRVLNDRPKVSSLQETLYSILDDLSIKYYREYQDKPADKETIIGPWSFDCVVPRNNKPWLLIECNGNWVHSLEKTIKLDKSKASYITNNLSDKYELKYLWEHELKCKDKAQELIKYWLGLTELELASYNFKDLTIKDCPASDYKLLLSKYHYLPNAGRGGIAYGAYLNNELVACCIFSPLIRQNITIDNYNKNEVRELSRLCIHPRYQKHNLASWFISRCIKLLPDKYKCVISYCDTTFNHDGATYKACNFKLDKIVKPDFWYVDQNGWAMHKKTLYNQAVNLSITTNEFINRFNYKKVYGKEKLRFIFHIK